MNNSNFSSKTKISRQASRRYLVKIQLYGPVHEDALHNQSSDIYNVLKKGIEDAAKTAFTDCPGNQVVADIEFSRGSFYAVFILISQGCHNVEKLRNILEETIKTGKFGRFLVSIEGFIFKALDDPIPPQFDHIEIVDTVINISWAKEKEIFFKTKHYLLQFTTDDWETCEEILTPADQNQYSILDTLPSTKYKFKIVTIAQGDIKSLPSKEIYIITRDSNTDIIISEHKEVGQSIKENINTRGDPENSEVLVKYEKEEQENIKTRGDSEKSEVHVKYEKEEQEHIGAAQVAQEHLRAAQVAKNKHRCEPNCKGLEEQTLLLKPVDHHFVCLAKMLGIGDFYRFFIHLGMSKDDYDNLNFRYFS
ncbi:uncharacterized protein, partial [Mytilus edulis]|uniref:uncharacterized protein n=1 Tax=Mytilus edulis TaxID=6550 RepID=UPI0039EED81C